MYPSQIHATAGGASAIIDYTGHIVEAAPQTFETTLVGLVQARTGLTPFAQFGDWFGILCSFAFFGCFVSLFYQKMRQSNAAQPA